MSEPVITAEGLTKRYGRAVAVDAIDLVVRRGEIFGLLGPNGAGKTTTILMLLGLTDVTAGRINVLGFDPVRDPLEVKRRVGYLPDSVGFYDNLTARENLRYTARLARIERVEMEDRIAESLARVGLDAVADKRVATFSRGMRQRLGLSEVLLKEAEVAILDEPTSGLDPQATFELLDIIRGLKADGVAVMISSHLLDRVQSVCDRVALFNRGRIGLEGTVADLAREVLGGGCTIVVEAEGPKTAAVLRSMPGVRRVTEEARGRFQVLADTDLRGQIAGSVVADGGRLLRLGLIEPRLDAIYARYYEGARDAA